ncbi:MAG: hypothetical protein M1837_005659 [Sclerophora amabilis]|nr:MAG: hypothetical protein M1837_005659 [Sclerophora amabilis]
MNSPFWSPALADYGNFGQEEEQWSQLLPGDVDDTQQVRPGFWPARQTRGETMHNGAQLASTYDTFSPNVEQEEEHGQLLPDDGDRTQQSPPALRPPRQNQGHIVRNGARAPSTYVVPPMNNPDDEEDYTSFVDGQQYWSAGSLPSIMGRLCPGPTSRLVVVDLLDESGEPVRDPLTGKRLKDYPFLPRKISTKVEGWRMEAYARLDGRITVDDLLGRMVTRNRPSGNVLNMRRRRYREDNTVLAWKSRRNVPSKIECETLEKLSQEQINANTHWTLIPPSGDSPAGIQQPMIGEEQPIVPSILPIGFYPRIPLESRQRIMAIQNEIHRLRNLASELGVRHWRELDPCHWNSSWRDRNHAKRKATMAARRKRGHEGDETVTEGTSSEDERPRKRLKTSTSIRAVDNAETVAAPSTTPRGKRLGTPSTIEEIDDDDDENDENRPAVDNDMHQPDRVINQRRQKGSAGPKRRTSRHRKNRIQKQGRKNVGVPRGRIMKKRGGSPKSLDAQGSLSSADTQSRATASNQESHAQPGHLPSVPPSTQALDIAEYRRGMNWGVWLRKRGRAVHNDFLQHGGNKSFESWIVDHAGDVYRVYFSRTQRGRDEMTRTGAQSATDNTLRESGTSHSSGTSRSRPFDLDPLAFQSVRGTEGPHSAPMLDTFGGETREPTTRPEDELELGLSDSNDVPDQHADQEWETATSQAHQPNQPMSSRQAVNDTLIWQGPKELGSDLLEWLNVEGPFDQSNLNDNESVLKTQEQDPNLKDEKKDSEFLNTAPWEGNTLSALDQMPPTTFDLNSFLEGPNIGADETNIKDDKKPEESHAVERHPAKGMFYQTRPNAVTDGLLLPPQGMKPSQTKHEESENTGHGARQQASAPKGLKTMRPPSRAQTLQNTRRQHPRNGGLNSRNPLASSPTIQPTTHRENHPTTRRENFSRPGPVNQRIESPNSRAGNQLRRRTAVHDLRNQSIDYDNTMERPATSSGGSTHASRGYAAMERAATSSGGSTHASRGYTAHRPPNHQMSINTNQPYAQGISEPHSAPVGPTTTNRHFHEDYFADQLDRYRR